MPCTLGPLVNGIERVSIEIMAIITSGAICRVSVARDSLQVATHDFA